MDSILLGLISRLWAIWAVPALPGATKISLTFGLWASFQTKVCSLAPPPTTSIFSVHSFFCRNLRGDGLDKWRICVHNYMHYTIVIKRLSAVLPTEGYLSARCCAASNGLFGFIHPFAPSNPAKILQSDECAHPQPL